MNLTQMRSFARNHPRTCAALVNGVVCSLFACNSQSAVCLGCCRRGRDDGQVVSFGLPTYQCGCGSTATPVTPHPSRPQHPKHTADSEFGVTQKRTNPFTSTAYVLERFRAKRICVRSIIETITKFVYADFGHHNSDSRWTESIFQFGQQEQISASVRMPNTLWCKIPLMRFVGLSFLKTSRPLVHPLYLLSPFLSLYWQFVRQLSSMPGYSFFEAEERLLHALVQWPTEDPAVLARDDQDECEIIASLTRVLLQLYAHILSTNPRSKESTQRKALDSLLEIIFRSHFRRGATTDVV
jgi:hypothetical protein